MDRRSHIPNGGSFETARSTLGALLLHQNRAARSRGGPMVRIPFAPAVSRQTIGSSAVIGVPDGDNPVQPIRPSRIGGKGRLIAEYADLIGAENLFAEYQCGLAAARGPPRSSPRRRPRRNPATSAGSRHRRKAAPIQQRQPAAGGFNWDRSWRIASTRTAGIGAQARRASLTDVSLTGSA